jgi:dephospho-CoA kinase
MPSSKIGEKMKVIGVTGGIGSGKSALLAVVEKEYNCIVLRADDIANFLKEPGQRCFKPLVELLGADVLDENGVIDKSKMSDKIFGNKALLETVNQIVHPAVKNYICECIQEEHEKKQLDYVFVEAALFIEAGYRNIVDSLWYIYAREEVRIDRLKEGRGYVLAKIQSIMSKQLPEETFRRYCDVVIDNSDDIEKSMEQVRKELTKDEIM